MSSIYQVTFSFIKSGRTVPFSVIASRARHRTTWYTHKILSPRTLGALYRSTGNNTIKYVGNEASICLGDTMKRVKKKKNKTQYSSRLQSNMHKKSALPMRQQAVFITESITMTKHGGIFINEL